MNNNLTNYYQKSIRLTPDGFSLYGLQDDGSLTQAFYPSAENALVTNLAPDFFKFGAEESSLLDIIVATRLPMLIPNVIYEESKDTNYLRMQFDISQLGKSFNESIGRYRSLFFLTQNEYSSLNELNCKPVFKSEISLFYDFLLQQESEESVLLSLNETFADFIVVQKGEPLMVNRTTHIENVDILYYTINCMQQMGLSSPTLYVKQFGKPNKKLNDLLLQYLDNIILL